MFGDLFIDVEVVSIVLFTFLNSCNLCSGPLVFVVVFG
jgi:hypothetical protein